MNVVYIITIHDIGNNFGSTLQACALCEFINKSGFNAQIINYRPKYAYNKGRLAQFVKKFLFYSNVKKQRQKFDLYYRDHVILTKRYTKNTQLQRLPKADVYVVGSDQVWNEFYKCGSDMAYTLGFTDSLNKMSYASSLGQLHKKQELYRLKERIKDFKYVSVREKASVEQLKSVGINNVVHVLDPVFLYSKDHYIDLNYENKFKRYLLIYAVHYDAFFDKICQKIAKKLNLKVVLIGGYLQKYKCDAYLRSAGPKDFINLINKSEFFLANSFHATAFSIILNKQFALVEPYYSSLRITDMLEVAGIPNRIIRKEEDIKKALEKIDYEPVNKKIADLVNKSKEYLLDCLNSFGEDKVKFK